MRQRSLQRSAIWLLGTGFRLGLWLLLTSDLSRFNLLAGLALALLLPRPRGKLASTQLLLQSVWSVVVALPVAYAEAIQLLSSPHRRERLISLPGSGSRSALVVFLEVFRITLTPLTIALGRRPDGSYLAHALERGTPR